MYIPSIAKGSILMFKLTGLLNFLMIRYEKSKLHNISAWMITNVSTYRSFIAEVNSFDDEIE